MSDPRDDVARIIARLLYQDGAMYEHCYAAADKIISLLAERMEKLRTPGISGRATYEKGRDDAITACIEETRKP